MSDRIAITLRELRTRAGVTTHTMRRWLIKRGVRYEGKSVLLSDIKRCWPALYDALYMREHRPACPECGAPTHHCCTVCDFSSVQG